MFSAEGNGPAHHLQHQPWGQAPEMRTLSPGVARTEALGFHSRGHQRPKLPSRAKMRLNYVPPVKG